MMPEQWGELLRSLGIAGPLVAVLMYMLREATQERKEINAKFLTALQTTVEQSNETRLRSANELADLTHALNEHQVRSGEEHQRIVAVLERMSSWDGHERRSGAQSPRMRG